MPLTPRRLLSSLGLAVAVLLVLEGRVFAQAEEQAAARSMFSEGRRLMDAGQYAQACLKFEAASKLYESAGILLNLGDCYEKTGRTASAWTTFGGAASVAARTNRREDAAEAKRRQTKLEPELARLSLHVTGVTAGMIIKLDGVEVPQAAWDAAVPVDPGKRELLAEASGYTSWSKSVSVTEPGKTVTVDVPALVAVPVPLAVNPAPAPVAPIAYPDETRPGATQRVIGLVIGGIGVVSFGVAGALTIVAASEYSQAKERAGTTAGRNDSISAGNLADAATVADVAGGVLLGAGAVIWITAPRASVSVGASGRALFLRGSF
jgi:tetratricopeptide (TPR) repeat protein